MKQDITLYLRQTGVSNPDGTGKTYRHDQQLCRALGSARELLLAFIGDRKSGASTVATITVYQGADPDNRPSDVGDLMEQFTYQVQELRPEPFPITGPFLGKLDITIEISENVAAPTDQQEFQFALYATLMK